MWPIISLFRVAVGPIFFLVSVQCRCSPFSMFRVAMGPILFQIPAQCRCGPFSIFRGDGFHFIPDPCTVSMWPIFHVQSGDGPHFVPVLCTLSVDFQCLEWRWAPFYSRSLHSVDVAHFPCLEWRWDPFCPRFLHSVGPFSRFRVAMGPILFQIPAG
jgi:hypothetical protein